MHNDNSSTDSHRLSNRLASFIIGHTALTRHPRAARLFYAAAPLLFLVAALYLAGAALGSCAHTASAEELPPAAGEPTGAPSFDFAGSYLNYDSPTSDPVSARLYVDVDAMEMAVEVVYLSPEDFAAGSLSLHFEVDESSYLHAGALLGDYSDPSALTRWQVWELAKPTGWLPDGWEPNPSWVGGFWIGTTLSGGRSIEVGPLADGPGEVEEFYCASHGFVSATPGRELPPEVWALLPSDRCGLPDGSTVTVEPSAFDPVAVDDGTWRFLGWDADSLTVAGADVFFTGAWEFEPTPEPDPTYQATFEFVSGTEGRELPEEVTALCPGPADGLADGSTVTADPSTFGRVDVDGGYWSFVGWDFESLTVSGADVHFVGTWVFTESVPWYPIGPADPVEPDPEPEPTPEPDPTPEPEPEPEPTPAPAAPEPVAELPQTGDASPVAAVGVAGAGAALSALGALLSKRRG